MPVTLPAVPPDVTFSDVTTTLTRMSRAVSADLQKACPRAPARGRVWPGTGRQAACRWHTTEEEPSLSIAVYAAEGGTTCRRPW